MKQLLSWKFLLSGWIILIIISTVLKGSPPGIFIEVLSIVFLALGLIDLIRRGIKRYKNNKIIKERVGKRMLDSGFDLEKNYDEYYKLLKEEEEKIKK